MKVLLGVDDSTFSEAAVVSVARRPWPADTAIKVVSAVEESFFTARDEPSLAQNPYDLARRALERALATLRAQLPHVTVTSEIITGSPKQVLVDEAEAWGADLIVVGSHGRRGLTRFLLGSVSQAVALHAPCSVEIVRTPQQE
jgi:nucleotide-binding universal stress UspA family protein